MAFEPNQIIIEVRRLAEITKKRFEKKKNQSYGESGELPEYYVGYNKNIDEWNSIKVHTDPGTFPFELFAERSPNQTDKEFEYVKKNYKQDFTTWNDYLNTVSRPFHRSNWSIDYKETPASFGDDTFQSYVDSHLVGDMDLEQYMRSIVTAKKAVDAEGIIAIKPSRLPVDEEGRLTDELIEPKPFYYDVRKVVAYRENIFTVVILDEFSPVTVSGDVKNEGFVFEFYDNENIWKVIQVGKKEEMRFEALLFFPHNWGQVPTIKLKGKPCIKHDRIFYRSPLLFAVDNLDEATLDESNLRLSKNNSAYPIKVMIGSRCEAQQVIDNQHLTCNQGFFRSVSANGSPISVSCDSCHGTGLVNRTSPMGTLLIEPPSRATEGKVEIDPTKAIQFIEPSTENMQFLREEATLMRNRARGILFLPVSNRDQQSTRDITATEVGENTKAREAFIATVSWETFDIYDFLLEAIGWMRYANDDLFTLNAPTTYDFTTEEDFLFKLKMAREAQADQVIISQIMLKYLKTIYFTEEDKQEFLKTIVSADRLFSIPQEEINIMLGKNTVDQWEEILHTSGTILLNELFRLNPNFFELELSDRVIQLQDLAKQKANEIVPETETEALTRTITEATTAASA